RAVATSDIRAEGLSSLELARVEERRGHWSEARELLSHATGLLEQVGETFGLARCFNALGDIARQTEQLGDAYDFTRRARERFEDEGMHSGVADCVNDLAEIALLEGDVDRAEALCEEALQLYESLGAGRSMEVRLTLGHVYQEQGRWEDASVVLQRARMFFVQADASSQLARSDAMLLPCLAESSQREEFVELLGELESELPEGGCFRSRECGRLALALETSERRGWSGEAQRLETLLERLRLP
ncbi:MAG: tetratricopeptide repeat protein, partial [Myxococcota bacterium]